MAHRILMMRQKRFFSLFNKTSIRYASNGRARPLGDQRTYFRQHLRQEGSVGGDAQFNRQQSFYQQNQFDRPRNVSGFDGRGRRDSFRRDGGFTAGQNLRPINWNTVKLEPIVKDFYIPHGKIAERTQTELDEWLQKHKCDLKGNNIPRPILDFDEGSFPDNVVEYLKLEKKYEKPIPVQSITWPVALSGRDMVSIAMTGSGKTLAFILPALMHIMGQPLRQPGEGPTALVMAPTRELAQQTEQVAREYCRLIGLNVTCCFGGVSKNPQANALQRGVDICIGTPGRLLDLLEMGITNMRRCSYLVLDEADRMLDMGFEPQIRKVVGQTRPDRQTLMTSATWPRDVQALASEFLNRQFIHLTVGSLDLAANHNIHQIVEVIDEFAKRDRLFELLNEFMKQPEYKTLIFAETKRKVDELTVALRNRGLPAYSIHGDKSQNERDFVIAEYKSGKVPILIATDVASRGLDVNNIKYVINYDFPKNVEDYVHRIGRTGRQDKKGTSYAFFTPQDAANADDLIKVMEEANQEVPQQLRQLAYRRR